MTALRVWLAGVLVTAAASLRAHVPMPPDGICPPGTVHICKTDDEAKFCTYRAFICDETAHCKNGEDEDAEGCVRGKQGTAKYDHQVYGTNSFFTEKQEDCWLEQYNQPVCDCVYGTRVACDNRNLTRIPSNISHNVTRMYIQGNRLVLRKGDLDAYTKLEMINLKGNGIREIPDGFFGKQTSLLKLLLRSNRLQHLEPELFSAVSSTLTQLLLDDNQLRELPPIEQLAQLRFLNLSSNKITLEGYEFPPSKLQKLHLDDNRIRHISGRTFHNLVNIRTLYLKHNRISSISEDAFYGLHNLAELYLSNNQLVTLHRSWFRDMQKLTVLHIGFNRFKELPEDGFHDLSALYGLDLDGLFIENATETMWSPLRELSSIQFSMFSYCAYTPHVKFCKPSSDGISSSEHLLDTTVHKTMIWLIAMMTVTGNLVVLWGRGFQRADDNKNVSVLICNLAVADLLMGVYLFVLAGKDVEYRGEYNIHALAWRESPLCVICGVLAMTSSEVAVMIMTFMSVDRFLAIVYPMVRQRASSHMSRTVLCCMSGIWICGLALAVTPVFYWNSFSTFYGINGICFPLHVQEPFFVGWEYSAFVFLGINVLSLVLIISSYVAMFFNIQQTQRNTPLVVREVEVALRFFCIVVTDCLCWTPTLVVKVLALAGVPIPVELHAWIVVFVLPINSAVNPFLYTFTTPKFYSRIKAVTTKYSSCVKHRNRRESVNVTGSESVGFTQRTSLQVFPASSERNGQSPSVSEALLTSHVGVADSKC